MKLSQFLLEGWHIGPEKSIGDYARGLIAAMTDPSSKYWEASRQGQTPEEYESNFHRKDDCFPYPKTAKNINGGHCENFAEELADAFPGGKVIWLEELYINDQRFLPKEFSKWPEEKREDWCSDMSLRIAHAVYYYRGKYYDSTAPDGVRDWVDLPSFRQIAKSEALPLLSEGVEQELIKAGKEHLARFPDPDYGSLWWNPDTKSAYYIIGDSAEGCDEIEQALSSIKGVENVEVEAEGGRPRDPRFVKLPLKESFTATLSRLNEAILKNRS